MSAKTNKNRSFKGFTTAVLVAAIAVPLLWSAPAQAQERVAKARPAAASGSDLEAKRQLDKGAEYISLNETERGVKMIETVIDNNPTSPIRFKAYLTLAKYFISAHDYVKAVNYLRYCKELDSNPDKPPTGDTLDLFLESLYLTGVANFEMRAYNSAFPPLRKITNDYPNTVWANQAHYYIGMCHFAQENWTKAIESLSLVGTFVDPKSPTAEYVEAGRRFYVKVEDADLPVLVRQGQKVTVALETTAGDKKVVECVPLAGSDSIYIGSIPTDLSEPKAGDDVLHVLPGDTITSTYIDKNTKDGKADVPRVFKSKVVSTATAIFTLGNMETKTNVVYQSEPIFISVNDYDMDVPPNTLSVKLQSRVKEVDDGSATAIAASVGQGDAQRYKVRDEITVKLTETGKHSGKFTASVPIKRFNPDQPVEKAEGSLICDLGDEVLVTYIDDLHVGGNTPREVQDLVIVASDISSSVNSVNSIPGDVIIAARKNLIEGDVYLQLGKIFKSMGLLKQGSERAQEGLDRVNSVLASRGLSSELTQQAFKLKWELQLVQDNFQGAVATCELFNRLFPESPFVDQALMGIGKVKQEDKNYQDAIGIYRRILSLPNSQVKAEAQFHIAEATELSTKPGSEAAIAQYRLVAERYRDSEYAGQSLAKMIDYYIEKKDFAMANDMLVQVFKDYPDEKWLDTMLLKWVMVAYRMQDYQKSFDKCQELIFQYPDSTAASTAKGLLPKIEKKLPGAAAGGGDSK